MDKLLKRLAWLIMILPPVYLAITWQQLPATVALHFDLNGQPDRYGSKSELLITTLVLTLVNAGIYLLLTNVHRIDPKKYAADNKLRLHRIAFAAVVFMAAVHCIIIYATVHHNTQTGVRLILTGTGLLFCIIGNYMHTIRPNYFAGIRLPWTLENEDNWRKTHLLAGKLFFAGGLLIAVTSLLAPITFSVATVLLISFGIVIASVIYSYRLYKQQPVSK